MGPGQWLEVDVVDVALTVLPDVTLPRRRRLTAAIGSGEQSVWCRRLDTRFARLRLDHPVPLVPGDRIVLRDSGARRTVAGAEVLDIAPAGKAASAAAHLEQPLGARLLAGGWIQAEALGPRSGLALDDAEQAIRVAGGESLGSWRVDPNSAATTRQLIRHRVHTLHADRPSEPGLRVSALLAPTGLDADRIEALLADDDDLVVEHGTVRERTHGARARDTAAGRELVAALEAAPFAPPPAPDRALVRSLVREGAVVDVDGIVFAVGAIDDARSRVVEALRTRGSLTIADARDLLGSTRKYVVPIMSHLDATGVTRRRGDDRIPGPRSGLVDPDASG